MPCRAAHRGGRAGRLHVAPGVRARAPGDQVAEGQAVEQDRHDHHLLARPERSSWTPPSSRRETLAERLQEQAFLVRGVEIALVGRARGPAVELASTRRAGGLVGLRPAPRTGQGAAASRRSSTSSAIDEGASEVEVAMQWNTGYEESIHTFANTINTHEGGMHEEGFKKALTNVINRYARAKGLAQGEGGEPHRRGHPRRPDRDRRGEARRAAVRGPDQDEARQHRDALVRRDDRERAS